MPIRANDPARVAVLGHLSAKRRWRGIPTWVAEFLRDLPREQEWSAFDLRMRINTEARRRNDEMGPRHVLRGMNSERLICLLKDMGFVKREVGVHRNVWSKPPLRTTSDETEA